MSIGILAHCFGKLPVAELASKVGGAGFTYVQLALSKAIADLDCSAGKLSPGMANYIAEQFSRNGVSIPVLGCYVNVIEPDADAQLANVQRFKEHLRNARHFGAAVVALEVGVPKEDQVRAEEWLKLRMTMEDLAEEAEKWGVIIGIEPANRHLIDTASALARFLQEVPSSNFGVVLDPSNLMTRDNVGRQDEVIQKAFRLLGERIVSLHAKDIAVSTDGDVEIVHAGSGQLNYSLFAELANQYKPWSYITLERVEEPYMGQASRFVREKFGRQ